MRLDLLNRLIEAQELTSVELTGDSIESHVDAVNQWRDKVLTTNALLDASITHEEKLAVMELETYSSLLIERLNVFLKQLQIEQQQLIKQNLAISAYNKAR